MKRLLFLLALPWAVTVSTYSWPCGDRCIESRTDITVYHRGHYFLPFSSEESAQDFVDAMNAASYTRELKKSQKRIYDNSTFDNVSYTLQGIEESHEAEYNQCYDGRNKVACKNIDRRWETERRTRRSPCYVSELDGKCKDHIELDTRTSGGQK